MTPSHLQLLSMARYLTNHHSSQLGICICCRRRAFTLSTGRGTHHLSHLPLTAHRTQNDEMRSCQSCSVYIQPLYPMLIIISPSIRCSASPVFYIISARRPTQSGSDAPSVLIPSTRSNSRACTGSMDPHNTKTRLTSPIPRLLPHRPLPIMAVV